MNLANSRQGKLPLYMSIARELESRILEGIYPVGSQLPTESDVGEEFGGSRPTVRAALRVLADRGYVRSRQGVGTSVVATSSTGQYTLSISKIEDLFANARNTYYAFHEIGHRRLDADLAIRVGGREAEDWYLITGVRWTNQGGSAISHIESFIPAEFASVVDILPESGSPFYSVLERHSGHMISSITQEIRSLDMPNHVANTVGLPTGSRALQILRRYASGPKTLIASFNWHRGDQFTYEMELLRRPNG
jgi:GntR family transcriptional regulator